MYFSTSFFLRLTTEAAEQLFKKSRNRVYVTHVLTDEDSCSIVGDGERKEDKVIASNNINSKKRSIDLTGPTQQHPDVPDKKEAKKRAFRISSADRLKLSINSTIQPVNKLKSDSQSYEKLYFKEH